MISPIPPVVAVKMPADLSGFRNGRLGPCHLVPVTLAQQGVGSLHHLAARAWRALIIAAHVDGHTLTATSIADLYRSFDQQERTFFARMTKPYNPYTCTTTTRRYQGETYWLRRGMAPVATPGTSNHGWGLAVDVALVVNGKVVAVYQSAAWTWLTRNAGRFGFSWEFGRTATQPGGREPWHIRYVAGDDIPADVLATEQFLGIPPLTPAVAA
jgi:LAS superfamily LD-carboxypeptidase LdcB